MFYFLLMRFLNSTISLMISKLLKCIWVRNELKMNWNVVMRWSLVLYVMRCLTLAVRSGVRCLILAVWFGIGCLILVVWSGMVCLLLALWSGIGRCVMHDEIDGELLLHRDHSAHSRNPTKECGKRLSWAEKMVQRCN